MAAGGSSCGLLGRRFSFLHSRWSSLLRKISRSNLDRHNLLDYKGHVLLIVGKGKNRAPPSGFMHPMNMAIFDEKYRVVAVESQRLVIRGVRSGEVLTIVNSQPDSPLSEVEYPPGKLIALS